MLANARVLMVWRFMKGLPSSSKIKGVNVEWHLLKRKHGY